MLRWFSYALPTTLPSISLREIIYKGYSISKPQIYIGLLISIGWSLLFVIVSIFRVKSKSLWYHSRTQTKFFRKKMILYNLKNSIRQICKMFHLIWYAYKNMHIKTFLLICVQNFILTINCNKNLYIWENVWLFLSI